MADIAAIFHWDLPRLETLELSELLAWRRRAVDRFNRMWGKGDR